MQAYLELKLSLELFKKGPQALTPAEAERLQQVVARQARIESLILASPEAVGVVVPLPTVEARLADIRKRYPTRQEFLADMEANGLTETDLSTAVTRDLRIEVVLERVSAEAGEVSEVDAEIYFRLHPGAFQRPEMRRVRHILQTYDSPAEQVRIQAQLEALVAELVDEATFAAAALKHSHCPSSLEGGLIGTVKPGQLYPELEPVLYAMEVGQVAGPVVSPMGLHLLRCDAILPGETLTFAEVQARIIEHLAGLRRQGAQKAWIQSLLGGAGAARQAA